MQAMTKAGPVPVPLPLPGIAARSRPGGCRPGIALLVLSGALGIAVFAARPALAAAHITIVNTNAPGEGFNDPTPAAPVGGNTGATIGEQRLIAFQYAAAIWASSLDSRVEIVIQSGFYPLPCGGGGAVLGAAGPIQIFTDFPRAPFPRTFYTVALANKLALADLAPGAPGTDADDIIAVFSSAVDHPDCLGPRGWYYGLDDQHGSDLDLVTVLLHEFAHGLGFVSFVNESTGANPDPANPEITDIYSRLTLDTTTGLRWNEMSAAERQASALNARRVVWAGPAVTAGVPTTLRRGTPDLRLLAPASLAGRYEVGPASFGPPLSAPGVSGTVVAALDPADSAGGSTTDACSTLTNAAEVAGKIAFVDRGTCQFTVKAGNAQAAGAIAVIVADNASGRPPSPLGGADPSITIPAVRVSQIDGNAIRAQLAAGVTAILGVDPDVFSGADPTGHALLDMTDPVQPGSSVSHWDPIAFPNQLMEPALNPDLTHAVDGVDLTLRHLRDIGWFPDADLDGVANAADQCPQSDLRPTVAVGGCETGVINATLDDGCTIVDRIARCAAGARNHGGFVSCVSALTAQLRRDGFLEGRQKGAIERCAAHSHGR